MVDDDNRDIDTTIFLNIYKGDAINISRGCACFLGAGEGWNIEILLKRAWGNPGSQLHFSGA